MKRHDVLLFPTLFDGFGLVITEAMSQGIPVITTTNSGGPECICHGKEGFIVPIRDSSSIINYLNQLDTDRDMLHYMKELCIKKSRLLGYEAYKAKFIQLIQNSLLSS